PEEADHHGHRRGSERSDRRPLGGRLRQSLNLQPQGGRLSRQPAQENPMEDDNEVEAINLEETRADIAAGAKALRDLHNHVADDWNRWSAAIRGLRGLRNLCWHDIGTTDMRTQAYRDAMGAQLTHKKNAAYAEIPKDTRSYMYQLCDHIEEVDEWYASL